MKIDMHLYGTYSLARAAGMNHVAASRVATAAQFVDDNTDGGAVTLRDGTEIFIIPTCRNVVDPRNFSELDQQYIWLPFHFLPGGEGATRDERLVCQKDTRALELVTESALVDLGTPHALERIGITAHVVADAYSHHGFQALASDSNNVIGNSIHLLTPLPKDLLEYVQKKFSDQVEQAGTLATNFVVNVMSRVGHGAVSIHPDRPYLRWRFSYVGGHKADRDNPADFLLGCERLHGLFQKVVEKIPDIREAAPKPFAWITPTVERILNTLGNAEGRSQAWREALPTLSEGRSGMVAYVPGFAHWQFERLKSAPAADAASCFLARFNLAALEHRNLVLHKVLPAMGVPFA
jgi:hypothetical protein